MTIPIDKQLDALPWTPCPPVLDRTHENGSPYETHESVLVHGDFRLRCYLMSDGQRRFHADDVAAMIQEMEFPP